MSGKVINYSAIARDVGVDHKTVSQYFSILEDTLIGLMLEPFHHSFRKRLKSSPKFYFYDTGVTRALARLINLPIQSGTSYYGELFEQFIVLECHRIANYLNLDYRFSYFSTKDNFKVDLVVERPGKPLLFIEIESSNQVTLEKLGNLKVLQKEFPEADLVCLCRNPAPKRYERIQVLPWQAGVRKLFYLEEGQP